MNILEYKKMIDRIAKNYSKAQFEAVANIVKQDTEIFENINRESLKQSLNSEEKLIIPEYSEFSSRRKGKRNPDLYDTGDFHRSIKLNTDTFTLHSDVYYAKFLESRYGNDIYGVSRPDLLKYISANQDKIRKEFLKLINR